MTSKTSNRPQFSLAALFGLMIGCGVLFGCLASLKTTYQMSIRCNVLPEDDVKLVKWFEGLDGVKEVFSTRYKNTVKIEFTTNHGYELFSPPLADFGYRGLEGLETRISKSSLLTGAVNWIIQVPVIAWFGLAGFFAILLARKILRPADSAST